MTNYTNTVLKIQGEKVDTLRLRWKKVVIITLLCNRHRKKYSLLFNSYQNRFRYHYV